VYVVKAGDLDLYKIGWSTNPEKRRQQLQTATPFALRIVAVLETDDQDAERRIHQTLRSDRQAGEWFQLAEPPTQEQLTAWATPPERPPVGGLRSDLAGLPWEDRLAVHRLRREELEGELNQAREARDAEVRACRADGIRPAAIARALRLSRQAVYDILRDSE
jgi:ribosomal protein S14